MFTKSIIFILLVLILVSLGVGFFYLSRDQGQSRRTLHALIVRIIITVLLAALIVVGILSGIIIPHPIG